MNATETNYYEAQQKKAEGITQGNIAKTAFAQTKASNQLRINKLLAKLAYSVK